MICDWPSWKENTTCLGEAEYSSSDTTRPSVNYAKDGLDQSLPITGLGWSKKRCHLWMWALWGSQQPFSCVLGHFRHGDTQVEVTGLNLSSVSARHSLKERMFWLSTFTTFTFLKNEKSFMAEVYLVNLQNWSSLINSKYLHLLYYHFWSTVKNCGFYSNRILLYFPMSVSVSQPWHLKFSR